MSFTLGRALHAVSSWLGLLVYQTSGNPGPGKAEIEECGKF